jgi:hypothetical protein
MTSIEIDKTTVTREAWLHAAVEIFRPRFVEIGLPLPERVHVSVGFGSSARAESKAVRGVCWPRGASADEVNHIFISPTLGDGGENGVEQVLLTLLHELIHAADDCRSGHRGTFAEAATRLGMIGRMTSSEASVELAAELMVLAGELGPYPHGVLDPTPVRVAVGTSGETILVGPSGPRTQTNRHIKAACPSTDHRPYSVRLSRGVAEELGLPTCPCGAPMDWA